MLAPHGRKHPPTETGACGLCPRALPPQSGRFQRTSAALAGDVERVVVVVRRRSNCGCSGEHRFLRALVQPFAAALHGREELLQVDLERGADRVGPVLDLETRLPRLTAGVVDAVLLLAHGPL